MATVFVSVFGAVIEYEFHHPWVYSIAILLRAIVGGFCKLAGAVLFVVGVTNAHMAQNLLSITTVPELLLAVNSGGHTAALGVGLIIIASILSFGIVELIWRLSAR